MVLEAHAWRPQAFGTRHARDVRDALVEPAWSGERVLVHVAPPERVAVLTVSGEDLAGELTEIADAIGSALTARSATLDGFITDQATRPSVGIELESVIAPTARQQVVQLFLGSSAGHLVEGGAREAIDAQRREQAARQERTQARQHAATEPEPEEAPLAFVAVDLLALDGRALLDVPLLERKRLLESVLVESELVRRTPFVRAPLGTWIATWRSIGFTGLAFKAANSRYVPGGRNNDWVRAPMPRR